jgi:hypothetical protein
MVLSIPQPDQVCAPTNVQIALASGPPGVPIEFSVDADPAVVTTINTDVAGAILGGSVPILHGNAGSHTIHANAVAAPPPSSIEGSSTGSGSGLAAGTYWFKLTGFNPTGETLPSPEFSVTIQADQWPSISWDPNSTAANERFGIYMSTTPAGENQQFIVDNTVDNWTWDGSAGATATPPTQDGSLGLGATPAFASFVFESSANTLPVSPAADQDPTLVEQAFVVLRWVLQDPTPGGLGSWVMPANPVAMDPLPKGRNLSVEHTTYGGDGYPGTGGRFHITEPAPMADAWKFSGVCLNKGMHDQLLAYAELDHRFFVIDHRNRAWLVESTGVEFAPRKRGEDKGTFNDWRSDYVFHANILDQVPVQLA